MASIIKVNDIQNTSGANIINESSNTITIGASGDTVSVPSGATFDVSNATVNGISAGITEADQWRLTSSFTGDATPIASNLERNDSSPFGKIGTGMTQSSGIFTFPSTGIYLVEFHLQHQFNSSADPQTFAEILLTEDNGSNWTYGAYGLLSSDYTNARYTIETNYFFDVQDVSTHKVRFDVSSASGTNTTRGSTDINQTWFNFIRLGDT